MQVHPEVSFWHLPGIASLATFGLGLLLATIGLFGRRSASLHQFQRGGRRSSNVQAGRDINMKDGGTDT
jgi:hypothetical protein